jgi:hypothetical protein
MRTGSFINFFRINLLSVEPAHYRVRGRAAKRGVLLT